MEESDIAQEETGENQTQKNYDNVILIGTMASGKTTVGWRLAKMIGYGYIDLDQWIEKKAGKRISEIFDAEGEQVFRMQEAEAVRDILNVKNHVISVGGGAVMDDDNWKKIKNLGFVVWLNTPPTEIARRLVMKPDEIASRPLLREAANASSKDERFRYLHDLVNKIIGERAGRYGEADLEFQESYSTPQLAATNIMAELNLN